MPLTEKGAEIKSAMEKQYGKEKGEQVFYASKNKGTITGVDAAVWSPSWRRSVRRDEEERRIRPGDLEEGDRIYGPQWGEECKDEAPFSSPNPPQTPPPSRVSNVVGGRDQAAYKPAGPATLSLEAVNKKNREYWAPDWERKK